MAEITEIIAKEAIKDIEAADKALNAFDEGIMQVIANLKKLNETTGKGGIREYNQALKEQNRVQQDAAKATRDRERAERKAAEADAKAAAKIMEHNEALKLNVQTVEQAKRQLKALTVERDKAVTSYGKQSKAVQELNARMQQNTEFIRANGTAAEKQRMNIGNYASAFNGLKTAAVAVSGALGLGLGVAGVTKVLGGIIQSTDATADAFGRTMEGLRQQTAYFARAVATMNFSNFIEGMREARKEGERYYDTLDLIEDKQRSLGLQEQDIEDQILAQKLIAKNKQNEVSVRQAAIDEIIRLEQLRRDKSKALADESLNNELTNAASLAKVHGQYKQEIIDFVKNYEDNIAKIQRGQELINKIRQQNTRVISVDQYGNQVTKVDRNQEIIDRARLNSQDREAIRMAEYNNILTKEKRDLIAKSIGLQQQANINQKQGELELVRLRNSLVNELIKEENATENVTSATEKQKTEVEKFTEKISKLRDELANSLALTGTAPKGIIREIIGSESELNSIQEQVKTLLLDVQKLQGKGTAGLGATSGANAGLLQPRTSPGAFGASDPGGSGFDFTGEQYIEATQNISDAAFQIISNADQAAYDNKIALLEKEKEAKLSNTKLTEKQRAKIEEEYRKKEAKIKEEQFRKNKSAQIIQSIINTALAVTNALATGGPAAPALAVAAGITGAAQTAVIAAQPVPQFDKGVLSTPSTFIAGENRPEWMIRPDGTVTLISRPTMFKNMAGATVIGGAETERMMKAGLTPQQDIRPELKQMGTNIVRAIKEKKELTISGRGSSITEREGNYYKTYFNRQVQWAGRKN